MVQFSGSIILFWLSLTPFVTNWMGASNFAAWPVATYGAVLLLCGFAYFILTSILIAHHGKESALAQAVGRDTKGYLSLLLYAVAIAVSFAEPRVACVLYVVVAIIWLIPDRRDWNGSGGAAKVKRCVWSLIIRRLATTNDGEVK